VIHSFFNCYKSKLWFRAPKIGGISFLFVESANASACSLLRYGKCMLLLVVLQRDRGMFSSRIMVCKLP